MIKNLENLWVEYEHKQSNANSTIITIAKNNQKQLLQYKENFGMLAVAIFEPKKSLVSKILPKYFMNKTKRRFYKNLIYNNNLISDKKIKNKNKIISIFVGQTLILNKNLSNKIIIYIYNTNNKNSEDYKENFNLPAKINQISKKLKSTHQLDFSLDPDWSVFEKQVYPNMAQMQTVDNKKALALRKKIGDDISRPRKINYYCAFLEELNLLEFQKNALEAGFAVMGNSFAPDQENSFVACVCKISTLDNFEINKITNTLCEIAENLNGTFEYWDCKKVIKK